MTHRKDLKKKGYKSYVYGSKSTLQYIAKMGKENGKFRFARIVPYQEGYELYVKR